MRVALYARCSTSDQSVDLQLDALRDYAKARSLEVVREYLDQELRVSVTERSVSQNLDFSGRPGWRLKLSAEGRRC